MTESREFIGDTKTKISEELEGLKAMSRTNLLKGLKSQTFPI